MTLYCTHTHEKKNKQILSHVLNGDVKTTENTCFLASLSAASMTQDQKKLNMTYCIGYYYSNKVPCDHIHLACTEWRIQ